MLAFAEAYRDGRRRTPEKRVARPPAGRAGIRCPRRPGCRRGLLVEHRVPIGHDASALTDADSPYAHAVAAVCETLPAATDNDVRRAQRLRGRAHPPNRSVCNRSR